MRNSQHTTPRAASRRELLADAALEVLGAEGARALTHRRVDEAASVPVGSTSNVFRSREDLLLGALDRLIEREFGTSLDPVESEATGDRARAGAVGRGADLLASLIASWATPEHRVRLQARFELLIEASRRESFRPPLAARRADILLAVERLMTATGRDHPALRAAGLVAWADGLLLHHLLDPTLIADEERLRLLIALQLD